MNALIDAGFGFAQPWFLLGLLLLPLLATLRNRPGGAAAVLFSSTETLREIGHHRRARAGNLLVGLTLLSLGFLITALARPQQGKTLSHIQASGIDIVLLIDVSKSMLAEDFQIGRQRANRLETVKKVTEDFINGRPNDRIGIIAFAGRPYLVSPLTLDHDWLLQNLERLRVGLVEDGTAIGSAIASGCNRLQNKDSKSRVLILLTDGDNNAGKVPPETAAEAAKSLGIKLYAIGAGTNGVAPFPVMDKSGRTHHYEEVKVVFDDAALKEIARIAGGEAFSASNTDSLEQIYKRIDQMEKSTVQLEQYKEYRELYPWFVASGFAFLTLQMVLSQTVWRKLP